MAGLVHGFEDFEAPEAVGEDMVGAVDRVPYACFSHEDFVDVSEEVAIAYSGVTIGELEGISALGNVLEGEVYGFFYDEFWGVDGTVLFFDFV